MATGTIIKWIEDKGFGFIKVDGEDQEVFFHHSSYEGQPREGESVEFDFEESDRGPRAGNVRAA